MGSAEDLKADRNTIVQACARESSQRMAGLLQKWFVSPFRTPNSNDLMTPMPHFTQTPSSANITAVRIKVRTQKHWETHSKHIHIIAAVCPSMNVWTRTPRVANRTDVCHPSIEEYSFIT